MGGWKKVLVNEGKTPVKRKTLTGYQGFLKLTNSKNTNSNNFITKFSKH